MPEHQDSTWLPTVPVHALEQQHADQAVAQPTSSAAVANHPVKGSVFPPTEELSCLWQGCSERCPTAEALYEHICERHVGRKSANNLNLTCQWGSCRTTTIKRDHITSHIRVHVSFKPHKCNFCGKAFKRPQDLKKHVKTHADDSVLARSPEPDARNQDVVRGGGPANTHCFERALNPVPGQGYPHGAAQYYQSHPPQPSSVHSYGNVYSTLNRGPETGHVSYEHKKWGYDALNEFVGDLKPRRFDPNSYATAGQWLPGLQNLSLSAWRVVCCQSTR
ncbi:hypothetical protein V6Z93_002362 [Aspergillus fumigatus]